MRGGYENRESSQLVPGEAFRDLRGKLLGAFTILPASVEDYLEAARLKNLCTSKGVNLSGIDCLIVATSIAGGHELFTAETDFQAISRLSILKPFEGTDVA